MVGILTPGYFGALWERTNWKFGPLESKLFFTTFNNQKKQNLDSEVRLRSQYRLISETRRESELRE